MYSVWRLVTLLLALGFTTMSKVLEGRLHANMPPRPSVPKIGAVDAGPVLGRNGTIIPPYNTTYTFQQLIDHNNPTLGTFTQRYWHTWEFYETGGPIILFTPGEGSAEGYEGYLTNATINGQIAQQENGATIVLEHRFYGTSAPYPSLTVEHLKVHTIQQAIDDLEYFSKNVKLPMPGGDSVTPDKTPWVLVGGSYSGALTSWTMVNKPNLFRAGYASSAVVESIVDFWQYFDPIRQFMPANCSADVQAVIEHIDSVFQSQNQTAITSIKKLFNMPDLNHLDDFAGALRNPLWLWQDLSPSTGPGAGFFEFCDALEVNGGVSAPESGWGLEHALDAWGSYWTNVFYAEICGDSSPVDCLGTYDPTQSYYTDTALNDGRSWEWIVCNFVGFFQEGAPTGTPTIVTRLVQPIYDERQCTYYFPQAFSKPTTPNVAITNTGYDGWFVNIERLFFANGQRDPWRDATLSADGTNFTSTTTQPIAEGNGYHCSDLSTKNAQVDETIAAVQKEALSYMKTWIAGFTSTPS